MKDYKFKIKKEYGMYEIRDADKNQHFFEGNPLVLPLGALVSFYRQLADFCYEECIGFNSIYGNQRDIPWMYAVLKDETCKKESIEHTFCIFKSDSWKSGYEILHIILDGSTEKYHFAREALNDLCGQISLALRDCNDQRIKVWADYVLEKKTEDVPLNFDTFLKWVHYVHPDTPSCYYEVPFDAWDKVDDRLTLRQNVDIAAAYIKDHAHDYD